MLAASTGLQEEHSEHSFEGRDINEIMSDKDENALAGARATY